MKYELQGDHLLFRYEEEEDLAGTLIGYIFDAESAVILCSMLNTSVALADATLLESALRKATVAEWERRSVLVTPEDMEKLVGTPEPLTVMHPVMIEEPGPAIARLYTWDGETELARYLHHHCDAAIMEGRDDEACAGCRGGIHA